MLAPEGTIKLKKTVIKARIDARVVILKNFNNQPRFRPKLILEHEVISIIFGIQGRGFPCCEGHNLKVGGRGTHLKLQ